MDEERRSELRRPGKAPWIVLALAVVAALAWFFVLRERPAPPPPASTAHPPAAEASPAPEASAGPAPPAERQRALLEAPSADPLYRRFVAGDDPVRRWAVVADNLAEGVSPRKQLPFLAPEAPFTVVRKGGKAFVAPASYARYDRFAAAVGSVDARAAAAAYRELHGVLEGAWRALGYPGGRLDEVVARGLRRVAAAPVRDGELEVVDEGNRGIWSFADPKLEDLPAVEKHLLRMGPRNARAVQAKAKELLDALGLGAR